MSRQYMIDYRVMHGYSLTDMARKAGCTEALLEKIESWEDEVTHPKIVERIAEAYGLTEAQRVGMLPENHRHGPGYDPNRYALPEEVLSNFTVMPGYVRVWK